MDQPLKNQKFVALGKLNRGIPRRFSEDELERRRDWMRKVNAARLEKIAKEKAK